MLAGTVLVGLSGYVFFAVIGHDRFDPATAAALAATYLLSNILGPGVFIAAEQESSRVISDARTRGGVDRTTVHRLAMICAGLALLTLAVLGLCAPVLLAKVLDGDVGLVLALMLAVVGSAAVYYIRGLAGGQQRFHRYAATTGIDGGARILGCLGLAVAGSTNPIAYALALCAGPAVAGVLTIRGVTPRTASPDLAPPPAPTMPTAPAAPTSATLIRGVGYLLVASFVSLAMANLAPVIVTGLSGTDPAQATGFAAAVVLTRVPLLLMGPIQALILPRLTLAAGEGRQPRLPPGHRSWTRDHRWPGRAGGGRGGAARALGGRAAGRPGSDTASTGVLILLTMSAMLQMAVQFLQPALVAVRRHRALVIAWVSGGVVFGLAFLIPVSPIDRGVLAQLAGPVVTLAIELAALRVALGASTGVVARPITSA